MDYFKDVYLKRMNIDGNTRQERVLTRKETEFDNLFMRRTEYLVYVNEVDGNKVCFAASLQPNKYNESEVISNLLISKQFDELQTGNILKIKQKIGEQEQFKTWLVLFHEDNITLGYQLYKLICLDELISLTDEYGDSLETFPVKFVNTSNKIIDDYFNMRTAGSYREQDRTIRFITKDFDFLKKTQYFLIKNDGWEISGIDRISVNGVAFVSMSQKLKNTPEPKSSADILVGEDKNFFLNNK